MMGIIVSKFGGTSMADANRFTNVRQIIIARKRRQYIILSAPGKRHACDEKITDLLNRAHALSQSGGDGSAPLAIVRARFSEIIRELSIDTDPADFLAPLEQAVRHSPDCAAAQGEYLCAKLFALYADIPFVDAASIIRFDAHGQLIYGATIDSIRRMAAQFPYAVIPGFYGSLPNGEIKTFSRGGSDITGALVAAALNAEIYENWTDVDGLMSADPNICPDAYCHPAVSYRQMRQLAQAGAQVLHPYCLDPVCERSIPTVLKNSFSPDHPGTYISDCVRSNVQCVCAQDGYRAVCTENLSAEAQTVAAGLAAEAFIGISSEKYIALRTEENSGEAATLISAFGLPAHLYHEASTHARAIAIYASPDCLRLLVAPENKAQAIRVIHGLLRNDQPCRI